MQFFDDRFQAESGWNSIIQIYSVIKFYMFRVSSLPSSGVLYCIFGTGKFHAGFWWPLPSRVRMELHYPNLFCYKILHVSGIFSAHHQEFSTVLSALVCFMQVFDDRFQSQSGWNSIIQIYSVIKLHMFRTSSVPIIRSFLLYIRHW